MLKIYTLTLGAYQTNCYIIYEICSKTCCVIDPGYEADTVLDMVDRLDLKVEAILLTHGHFDHVGAVREIASETGCRVYLHEADLSMPPMMTAGPLYYTHTYTPGEVLTLAGLVIEAIHTPGHTPGSVCLFCGDAIFSGDTLFAGSCGRTDLPGGDWDLIHRSLRMLAGLDGSFRVYPGHGPDTTLAHEKRYNSFIR